MAIQHIATAALNATNYANYPKQIGDMVIFSTWSTAVQSLKGYTEFGYSQAGSSSNRRYYQLFYRIFDGTADDNVASSAYQEYSFYRGASGVSPALITPAIFASTVNFPALTPSVNDGTSWVGYGYRGLSTHTINPSGLPSHLVVRSTLAYDMHIDTNGGVSGEQSAFTATVNYPSIGAVPTFTSVYEILADTDESGGGGDPDTTGYVKTYNGTAWELKPIKRFNGTEWKTHQVKKIS